MFPLGEDIWAFILFLSIGQKLPFFPAAACALTLCTLKKIEFYPMHSWNWLTILIMIVRSRCIIATTFDSAALSSTVTIQLQIAFRRTYKGEKTKKACPS
jgi:hypothetical protein